MADPRPRSVMFLNWRDTRHPQGGGSERYVEQLAAWLAEDGHRVFIHCARYRGSLAEERRDRVVFLRRGGRLTVYPWGLLAVIRRRPDLVIDVENGVPFFSPFVHRRVIRLVHHLSREVWLVSYGSLIGRLGWWVESRLVPRVYRRAACMAVSEPTREDAVALGVPAERVAVVHNATEAAERVTGVAVTPTPTLCVVARLVAHKRVEHAIEVLARLVDDVPDLRLRVVGDGPARDRLAGYARRRGVLDRVDLLGWLEERDKQRVLATSWVLLCPSIKEGWARVVMEAGRQQVPTVAYRSGGGVGESIRHGETGLLAEDMDGLVKHTRWLLEHPEQRAAMGRAAADHAAGYTAERTRAEFRHAVALTAAPTAAARAGPLTAARRAVIAAVPPRAFASAVSVLYPRVEPELRGLAEYMPRGGTALDVGAWFGPWSRRMSRHADQVVAIEAHPRLAALLSRSQPGLRVVPAAASDDCGVIDLRVPLGGPAVGLSSVEASEGERLEVPKVTIDSLDLEDVRFIKMDVEGHELAALRGAEKTIRRDRPMLIAELEARLQPIDRVIDLLASWGYTGFVMPRRAWVPLTAFDLVSHQRAAIARVDQSFVRRLVWNRPRYVNMVLFRP
jgi:FkbM family methyltransferase